jgi:hypothetical protein
MRELTLTRGKVALVDDDVYDDVSRFKWQALQIRNCWYARRDRLASEPKHWPKKIYLHQYITGFKWRQVDHEDQNGLNCQRYNMRPSNESLNEGNSRKQETYAGRKCSSKYKGVYWDEFHKKWKAQIHNKTTGKTESLGYYVKPGKAARAYLKRAIELFGEFAYQVPIDEEDE